MSLETNLPNINQPISSNAQQSAAVAYLGQLALSNPALEDLLADATTLVAQALSADLTLIWELEVDRRQVSLKSLSNSKTGAIRATQIPLQADSFEACILHSPYPITVSRLESETRFKLPDVLFEHGAVSGIGILIGTMEKPYGAMEVFSQQFQTFAQTDIHFLQSIANILASFIELKRKESQWDSLQQQFQTQLRKAQSILESSHGELDRFEIQSRLVESREGERLRLAQELHDTPIQDLYGLMYQLDDLKDHLVPEGEEILEEFNRTLHRVVDSLRSICGELRPPSLSPFGLEVAIRDHVEKVRDLNPELEMHLDLMRDQQVLSDSLRLCLFRIYQQAMSNIVRHAQATDVHLRFRWDEQVIILEVEDNGRGFDMPLQWIELVRRGHFGLVGLVERVESVHGKLEISSVPGDGTLVRVIIPRR